MKHHHIKSIEQLVAALGGSTAVGDWLGLAVSDVSNWMARQFIPPGWHLRLYLEAQRRHLLVDLSVFGLSDTEAVPHP